MMPARWRRVNPVRRGATTRDRETQKRNKKLEAELERTRLALDIVGKAHALLEKLSKSADNE